MGTQTDTAVRVQQVVDMLFEKQHKVLHNEMVNITDTIATQTATIIGGFIVMGGNYRAYRTYPLVTVPAELSQRAQLFHSNCVKVERDRKLCFQTLTVLTLGTNNEAEFRQCLPPSLVDLAGYGHIPADGKPFTRLVMNPANIKNGLDIIDYYVMTQYLL